MAEASALRSAICESEEGEGSAFGSGASISWRKQAATDCRVETGSLTLKTRYDLGMWQYCWPNAAGHGPVGRDSN